MADANSYNNLIFTNHALQRLKERKFMQQMAWETFIKPDSVIDGKHSETKEFRRRFDASVVTLIAKQNEKQQWVVLSCWIDPPLPGTKDYKEKQRYNAYQKAGFWRKFWLTIKSQLGL
jgi:hypothetical protein